MMTLPTPHVHVYAFDYRLILVPASAKGLYRGTVSKPCSCLGRIRSVRPHVQIQTPIISKYAN